ncbi:MDR family MFS transporter [Streptomyces murinus]|uniref:MDR family MFS transporter n=1 Tax=Streptomyces murinus TaxID=33900 RepID=UPI0038299869
MPSKALMAVRKAVGESFTGLPASFWWLWTATLVNRLAAFVGTFLAIYLTQGEGYSASFAGLVVSLYGGGAAAASMIGGALTDRIGRRPTVLVAQLATAVSIMALGLAEQQLAIAVLAFVVGVASFASRPAMAAMIADLVPEENRGKAYSLNFWAANIGFGVSAAAAGLLAEQGYLLIFIGEAVATLVCAALVFVKVPETKAAEPQGPADQKQSAGYGVVLKDATFMSLIGLTFLVVVLFQQAATVLPITMGQEGLSSTDYGLVLSLNGLAIVVLQIPLTRVVRNKNPLHVVAVAALLCGYGFGLTALADSLPLYAATVLIWTLGEILFAPVSMQVVARLSPDDARGRYQGMYGLAWSLAALVTPVASGVVLDHLGADVIWITCAVIGTTAAVGYALLARTLPNDTKADEPEPAPAASAE